MNLDLKFEVDVCRSYGPIISEKETVIKDSSPEMIQYIANTIKLMSRTMIKALEENYL